MGERPPLDTKDIHVAVARAKQPLLDAFDASGLTEHFGASHFYPNLEAAVRGCAALLNEGG